ncbi:MAG: hypothetical protein ACR2OC_04055 [Solirubrobacterales bacterium]
MAPLIWFTIAVALWHFTVFFPDRFWGGIIGAFVFAIIGGMATGAAVQIALGRSVGDVDIGTLLAAVPGTLIALAAIYAYGAARERAAA